MGSERVMLTYTKVEKGKIYPRTDRECPEGERRNSSTLSSTSTLDVDVLGGKDGR